jgi:hypothetical protein
MGRVKSYYQTLYGEAKAALIEGAGEVKIRTNKTLEAIDNAFKNITFASEGDPMINELNKEAASLLETLRSLAQAKDKGTIEKLFDLQNEFNSLYQRHIDRFSFKQKEAVEAVREAIYEDVEIALKTSALPTELKSELGDLWRGVNAEYSEYKMITQDTRIIRELLENKEFDAVKWAESLITKGNSTDRDNQIALTKMARLLRASKPEKMGEFYGALVNGMLNASKRPSNEAGLNAHYTDWKTFREIWARLDKEAKEQIFGGDGLGREYLKTLNAFDKIAAREEIVQSMLIRSSQSGAAQGESLFRKMWLFSRNYTVALILMDRFLPYFWQASAFRRYINSLAQQPRFKPIADNDGLIKKLAYDVSNNPGGGITPDDVRALREAIKAANISERQRRREAIDEQINIHPEFKRIWESLSEAEREGVIRGEASTIAKMFSAAKKENYRWAIDETPLIEHRPTSDITFSELNAETAARLTQGTGKIHIAEVTPQEAGEVSAAFKNQYDETIEFKPSQVTRTIDGDQIRHTLNKHGDPKTEGSFGGIAVTLEDITKYPEIVRDYDYRIFTHTKQNNIPAIVYGKQINGYTIVVEEVRTGRGNIAFFDMYKHKGKLTEDSLRLMKDRPPTLSPASNRGRFAASVPADTVPPSSVKSQAIAPETQGLPRTKAEGFALRDAPAEYRASLRGALAYISKDRRRLEALIERRSRISTARARELIKDHKRTIAEYGVIEKAIRSARAGTFRVMLSKNASSAAFGEVRGVRIEMEGFGEFDLGLIKEGKIWRLMELRSGRPAAEDDSVTSLLRTSLDLLNRNRARMRERIDKSVSLYGAADDPAPPKARGAVKEPLPAESAQTALSFSQKEALLRETRGGIKRLLKDRAEAEALLAKAESAEGIVKRTLEETVYEIERNNAALEAKVRENLAVIDNNNLTEALLDTQTEIGVRGLITDAIEAMRSAKAAAGETAKTPKVERAERVKRDLAAIDPNTLTDEQRLVREVYTEERGAAVLRLRDLNDMATLEQGSRQYGARKIILRHGGIEAKGGLTPQEMLEIGGVIRNGEIASNSFSEAADSIRYAYDLKRDNVNFRVVIEEFNDGKKIIDYYSDRNFIDYGKPKKSYLTEASRQQPIHAPAAETIPPSAPKSQETPANTPEINALENQIRELSREADELQKNGLKIDSVSRYTAVTEELEKRNFELGKLHSSGLADEERTKIARKLIAQSRKLFADGRKSADPREREIAERQYIYEREPYIEGFYPRPSVGTMKEAAKEFRGKYKYIGVRTQDRPFELGAVKSQSNKWISGTPTNKSLGGLSVTNVRSKELTAHALDTLKSNQGIYAGYHTALIGGNTAKRGEDKGELVITDPRVLKIFRADERAGGAAAGSTAGIEQDENGNPAYNPAKGLMGAAGGFAAGRAVNKRFNPPKPEPQMISGDGGVKSAFARSGAVNPSAPSARQSVSGRRSAAGRLFGIDAEEQGADVYNASAQSRTNKESKNIYKVQTGEKPSTIIRKDWEAIDKAIKFERGFEGKKSGYGALHIEKHLDPSNNGWVTMGELIRMGEIARRVEPEIGRGGVRIYQEVIDGVRFRIIVGDVKDKSGKLTGERVISFFSNRKPLKGVQPSETSFGNPRTITSTSSGSKTISPNAPKSQEGGDNRQWMTASRRAESYPPSTSDESDTIVARDLVKARSIEANNVSRDSKVNNEILRKHFIKKDGLLALDEFKKEAEPFRTLEYTKANFIEEFPDGQVRTPIGDATIHLSQFEKLERKDRAELFGLIKPTLNRPLFISEYDGVTHFIKPFKRKDGQLLFTSVAKDGAGGLYIVSNYDLNYGKLSRIIQNGNAIFARGRRITAKLTPLRPTQATGKAAATEGYAIPSANGNATPNASKSQEAKGKDILALFGITSAAGYQAAQDARQNPRDTESAAERPQHYDDRLHPNYVKALKRQAEKEAKEIVANNEYFGSLYRRSNFA